MWKLVIISSVIAINEYGRVIALATSTVQLEFKDYTCCKAAMDSMCSMLRTNDNVQILYADAHFDEVSHG